MSHVQRLKDLSDIVKDAGMRGENMTETLHKVAEIHDLTVDEIDRVAELANREVQLGLYKSAEDKRFKFDLAKPSVVKQAARKSAGTTTKSASATQKLAYAIDEVGGDPFASPLRDSDVQALSLATSIDDERCAKIAEERQDYSDRELFFALGEQEAKLLAIKTEGDMQEMKIAQDAAQHHKQLVQSAVDLVTTGITLPSLYDAIVAAVSGSTCTEEEKETSENILRMIISALKEKGIPNYRMGFRDHGDPEALDSMTEDDLVTRCKQLSSYEADPRAGGTITHQDVKSATVLYEEQVKHTDLNFGGAQINLQRDAEHHMRTTATNKFKPQRYLDDADNFDKDGKPVVVNANSEFIVAVKNLVGDQTRMRQTHSAQEYIGLKLKQIEEAMSNLREVRMAEKDNANREGVG